jgi:hypothetical protein
MLTITCAQASGIPGPQGKQCPGDREYIGQQHRSCIRSRIVREASVQLHRSWLIAFIAWGSALMPIQHASAQSPQARRQTPVSPQEKPRAATPAIDPDDLPVSLDRIQAALAHTPMLRFDENNRPLFRVQVFGEKPTIEDILGPDWATGPVPHGSLTHQEFLAMVTPKDVQGYAAFSNEEGATVAASSFVLQWTLQRALRKLRESQDERERAAARQEVLEAVAALEEARAKAGLKRK